jgi:hypothetical protein
MRETTQGSGSQREPMARKPVSSRLRLLPTVLTGLYSWGVTVFPVVLSEDSGGISGAFALVAVLALLSSMALPPGRAAMIAALDVFVLGSGLSWWLARNLGVGVPFPLFGSLGWLCYTLAVGAVSMPTAPPEEALPGQNFNPRTLPSRLAAAVLLLSLLGGIALLLVAWQVQRAQVSVLAHVLALCGALLLLRAGASLAVHFQQQGTPIRSDLGLRGAVFPLLCFLVLAMGGTLWLAMAG